MVDSLIRQQMDALEGASDDARVKLREWELPECLQVCSLCRAVGTCLSAVIIPSAPAGSGHLAPGTPLGCLSSWPSSRVLRFLQALDAGSAAALPDGLRAELEQLEEHGGVRHLQELQNQVKVTAPKPPGMLEELQDASGRPFFLLVTCCKPSCSARLRCQCAAVEEG